MMSLRTRGPDFAGVLESEEHEFLFMHRRLAIRDLSSRGNQPMQGGTHLHLSITYNGEIYNTYALIKKHLDGNSNLLKANDTRIILELYDKYGRECLELLEGMYAFGLWDSRSQKLLLARDGLGQKPLFFSRHDSEKSIAFASTPTALKYLLPKSPNVSRTGLAFMSVLGYVPAPHSVFEGMSSLEPGQWLEWNRSTSEISTGFHYLPPSELSEEPEISVAEFADLFENVCRQHSVGDVDYTVLLSGGLDSSAIALGLKRAQGGVTRAVSLRQGSTSDDEVELASFWAQQLGARHKTVEFPVTQILSIAAEAASIAAQPQGFSALGPWYFLSEHARPLGKFAISGDGGDEVFGGYSWYYPSNSMSARGLARGLNRRRTEIDREWLRFAGRSTLHSHLARVFPRYLPDEAASLFGAKDHFSEETVVGYLEDRYSSSLPRQLALQRLDLLTFCTNHICAKTDAMSMAHSLEIRAPLLDRRLVSPGLAGRFARLDTQTANTSKLMLRQYLQTYGPPRLPEMNKRGFSIRGFSWPVDDMLNFIRHSQMYSDGLLNSEYFGLVRRRARYRPARIFVIWSLAHWYERHCST